MDELLKELEVDSWAIRLSLLSSGTEGSRIVRTELLPYRQVQGTEPAGSLASHEEPLKPQDRERLDAAVRDLARAFEDSSPAAEQSASETMRLLRDDLRRLLFPDPVRRFLFRSLRVAAEGRSMTVRLQTADEWLSSLPWECALAEPAQRGWSPMTALVLIRDPVLSFREDRTRRIYGFNVLLVASGAHRPPQYPRLDGLDSHLGYLEQQLKRPMMNVFRVPGQSVTRGDLVKWLEKADFHLVHFVGHGFHEGGRSGFLLQDEQGQPCELPSEEFVGMLRQETATLAFIEACEVGRAVAESLVRNGAPAAVGMQFKVPATVAAKFTDAFYDSLVRLEPLDRCFQNARDEISTAFPNKPYWSIPVMVSSSSNLALFDLRDPETRKTSPRLERHLCVMFTDVVGSRSIYASLGDEEALRVIKRQEQICEEAINHHHGKPIKSGGDSVMATFQSARDGVQAAFLIQRQLRKYNVDPLHGRPVDLRIGIHCGPAVAEATDVYGQMVNIAAHINRLTGPGGVMISADVYHLLHPDVQRQFAYSGPELFKGVQEVVELYTSGGLAGTTPSGPRTLAGVYEEWSLDEFLRAGAFRVRAWMRGEEPKEAVLRDRLVSIGRSKECNLCFAGDDYIGRHHAILALVGGIPWIFDNNSKAGVVVTDPGMNDGAEMTVVRRGPLRPGQTVKVSTVELTVEPMEA